MGTFCNELNSLLLQSISSSIISFTPGAGHSFPGRAGERERWSRTSAGTGRDQRDKGKGRRVKGKVKTLFCTSSASAKAFRILHLQFQHISGEDKSFSFSRSRPPGPIGGKRS